MKTTIFEAACCEGCGLQVGNHGARVVGSVRAIDALPLREVVKEQSDRYNNNIAINEDSIRRLGARPRYIHK